MKSIKVIQLIHSAFFGFLLIFPVLCFGQSPEVETNEELVNWTEDGMVIFASNAALSPEKPDSNRVEAVIYRSVGNTDNFEEIVRLQRASTLEEFRERAGEELVSTLIEATDSESEEEMWEFVKQNPGIENYGFLGFNQNFWRAFGTAYFDRESTNFQQGETIHYQVQYVMENGSMSEITLSGSEIVGNQPNLLRPQIIDRIERDSLVGGTWASPLEGSEDALFGRLYQQTNSDDDFEMIPERVMARRMADSLLVYQWQESVEPENAYRYFIEPVDVVGNTGPRSDTLTVISVDFENLPLFGDITAKDTISGIHLSWEQIPQKPYLTGIEIRRSRDARQEYLTLDTLSIAATEYLDTQLVPNRSYYYEFRVVTMRETNELPSGVASASHESTLPPSPPSGLTAVQEDEGVRLNWDSVEEPNLYAYYVYRGTSRYDSLAVVSPAIKDTTTFFDNAEELSGRTNYVYTVKAVSNNKLESELSNQVVIRPDRVVRPPAPVGIEGYSEQSRVRLFWSDQTERDPAVKGYHLYRSKSPMEITPDSAAASIQAEQAGFERVNDSLITTTSFDDVDIESGQTYYYTLSSVDVFDVESLMSNTARFTPSEPGLMPPSQVSVRTVSAGVELRWNQTLQDGATGYRVYRRTRGQADATSVGTNELEETRFTDENISEGELYWYSVSVIGENAESKASPEESVRID